MRRIVLFLIFILVVLTPTCFLTPQKAFGATTRVDLLTTDNFAILAGSAINDTTPSVINGDVGLSPASGAFIFLTCTEVVTGTVYSVDASGPLPCRVTNPGLLTIAKNDLTTAYNNAAGRTTTSTIGTELGGATLTDGVYDSGSTTFEISAGQTLTLNGGGNVDSVFIFKMGTSLTTFSSSRVVLTNGAQACNVYWQVGSSAVLGTGTTFIGNVMADQSITDNGGSTINGRLLARVAAVTLNNTHVSKSTCAAGTVGAPASTSLSSSSSNTLGSSSISCPTINYIVPVVIESRRISPTSIFISWGPYSGINTFVVVYGLVNGNWLYSTNVTGFSTTIHDLPPNQPIWVRIAGTDGCSVGTYSAATLVGGPLLPNTGLTASHEDNIPWYISFFILVGIPVLFVLNRKKDKRSSKH